METMVALAAEKFRKRFTLRPTLVLSPGRVNLIGEHTDYNEGFVLPAATDKAIVFAVAPRPDAICHFISLDFDQEFRCELDGLHRSPLRWPDYLQGVIGELLGRGCRLRGFNCLFGGDIPIGAGMSSSAAIEGGLAFALNVIFSLGLDGITLAKLAQRAENDFVGVHCGIMDQFINLHGRPRSVLKLDCRSLEYEYYPFERPDLRIVVCDTLVRRELASSEYNVRRRQCEEGAALVRERYPQVRSLRDVSLEMLEERRAELDPVIFKRCAYVIKENGRLLQACGDLARGDFRAFGEKMRGSHEGLRDEYEVSCPELDALVEAAAVIPGCLGARMMGAGFGGCTINLVEEGCLSEFRDRVGRDYEVRFARSPKIHVVGIEGGTRLVEI